MDSASLKPDSAIAPPPQTTPKPSFDTSGDDKQASDKSDNDNKAADKSAGDKKGSDKSANETTEASKTSETKGPTDPGNKNSNLTKDLTKDGASEK